MCQQTRTPDAIGKWNAVGIRTGDTFNELWKQNGGRRLSTQRRTKGKERNDDAKSSQGEPPVGLLS